MTKNEEEAVIVRPASENETTPIDIILSTYFLDRDDIPYEEFYVAEKDGKIIGCAVFEKLRSQKEDFWFYEIHTIAVLPSYKGKGIGKLLLSRLISIIEEEIETAAPDETISRTIYTRTTAPNFFIHEGFENAEIEKTDYWEECVSCNNIEICSQTVLTKTLNF
ncbi:hypothetical protein MmiEs2_15550 [Methanimicrococcus stummii]|uniref:N-acetyltransferase domain-containing protein n=1 Tax=Methanimicrococcus stummii TaxID=3028294 RepID=A0AA96VCH9_9EURY|nr:GNAT family N-acetyltransferase [Methanimicrococcus sp. Es2]WNY29328.1 hypothetical protein MmiEs2_15550 [Methanimicrococcus sp. Es2]